MWGKGAKVWESRRHKVVAPFGGNEPAFLWAWADLCVDKCGKRVGGWEGEGGLPTKASGAMQEGQSRLPLALG